ncbi:hypothetical protein HHK36_033313 [Tetracentron sinense]|uniref:Cytochrome P450 n=1 Tax=Tetracentron sinense TaxID=13715 RepID=A0A835CWW6_TETSI|nr:hypothetical protein HHK36_033313 [Tetracentron sinense]
MDVIIAMADDKAFTSLSDSTPERKNTVIKSIIQSIIYATMDTTSVSIEWALSELLSNPQVLGKAQEEIDTKIGTERRVEESDLEQLPYLQAIVKETLRLHPPGPLLVPHESTEDCVVSGFKIPAGTRLIVNAWKIHRDPRWWDRPLEFCPERFIKGQGSSSEVDLRGQHFQFIPFGAGRKVVSWNVTCQVYPPPYNCSFAPWVRMEGPTFSVSS